MIEGCMRDAYHNPITGESNILCTRHLRKVKRAENINKQQPKYQSKNKFNNLSSGDKDRIKRKNPKQEGERSFETFVLRGHTLTINYTGKTKHINVNRLTRVVKYNDDKEGSSGKIFHYVIDIKQGTELLSNILYDNKKERDRDFERLQMLLSRL
jgi:hypothetical protein